MKTFSVILLLVSGALMLAIGQSTKKHDGSDENKKHACFSKQVRTEAERTARVYHEPDAGYDPVLGYSPSTGPHRGAPPIDANGLALPFACKANVKDDLGPGTLPKFYCSVEGTTDEDGKLIRYKIKPHFKGPSPEKRNGEVYGEFLSSRFSQAMGFYAHDAWVADVTCPDCEKSLTKKFQGAPFSPFQPAAGIELSLGKGIDVDCNGNEYGPLARSLDGLAESDERRPEIDAFKLWLAFIDHGDTKTTNEHFACLKSAAADDGTLKCEAPIYFVSDMGSTFGYSSASEKKARLDLWKKKDPIRVTGDKCYTTAKDIGDPRIIEAGRKILADNLQRLLDAEAKDATITRVFRASRNSERDQPAEAWTAEFIRKANTVIHAKCSD